MSTSLTSMRLDKNLIEKIKEVAKKENRTFSNVCETILKENIDKRLNNK